MNKILKEEEYVSSISEIIEKNYFPDKKKFCLLTNLLEAQESGNQAVLKATEEMLKKISSEKPVSLDAFLCKNTSEDNVLFSTAQKKSSEKFMEKHWWLTAVPKALVMHIQPDQPKLPLNSLMFMPEPLHTDVFSRPHKKICANNTRLQELTALQKGFFIPELSEKETLARKLTEQRMSSSEKPFRFSTPGSSKSSRISSIFPVLNYQLPLKRNRN